MEAIVAGKTLTSGRRPLRYWLSPSPYSKKGRITGLELAYAGVVEEMAAMRELIVVLASVTAADGTDVPDIPAHPRHLQAVR
jgi:hypothetical protein